MMAAEMNRTQGWIEALPPLKGRLRLNADLAKITWFRVGGQAEVMFRPEDVEDLQNFLAAKPADIPVTVIGVGSNLLVRDGGVPGVVVRLGKDFSNIAVDGNLLRAGAATPDLYVARAARDHFDLERVVFFIFLNRYSLIYVLSLCAIYLLCHYVHIVFFFNRYSTDIL